ncbi:MAG: FadR family transcriptional regulator [Rhizobiaceae bacterium]|nr:FadR family transcriptional regulator [Rhizobiaceae bacterium]
MTEQLTDLIVSGQIKTGVRLPSERELGQRFGVSRTVIREAVRSLTARGLLRVTSGRGIEVEAPDPRNVATSMRLFVKGRGEVDYGQVHEVRSALEVQAAGLAAVRAAPDQIVELENVCAEFEKSLSRADHAEAAELDVRFHRILASAAGNDLLSAVLDSISDILQEVRNIGLTRPGAPEQALAAHRWILECVRAKDSEAARRAMERHLSESERFWRGGAREN